MNEMPLDDLRAVLIFRESVAMNIELHPLCTLFPRVTGREFDELVADIKGQRIARSSITTRTA